MKTFLMHPDRDFDLQGELPVNAQTLVQDLELETVFAAMAQGDRFLYTVVRQALLSSLEEVETIRFRQEVLKDCLKNADVVRELYQVPIEAAENKKKHHYGIFSKYPSSILSSSIEIMQMFLEQLKHLRRIADEHAHQFESAGFRAFFAMLEKELDDDYFACMEEHLRELRFKDGVLISGQLGKGNEGEGYVLRKPNENHQHWILRLWTERRTTCSFTIADRDEAGGRYLSELKDRGINLAANALAQSADHIENYFKMMRIELAFYIGCLNLSEKLAELGEPIAFPELSPASERRHAFDELYDISLALTMNQKVVGNAGNADGKNLVMITGANQGGKSTFLRSIGLAQLMMQCGMFAPAKMFRANVCRGLFTHYKRKEDSSMKSGKLDEELERMSEIVDHVRPNSLVLFNESFAATNEREGSEIARQITCALLDRGIKVFFVTHLYQFASVLFGERLETAAFLRAERQDDGNRTFKVHPGRPLETSFGEDVYRQVFGANGWVD